jgi:Ni,Fe-hydrogenase maturation factor
MSICKVLVFGNKLVKKDNLPLKLIPHLEKEFPEIEFKEFDSVEDLQNEGSLIYIIDSVENIENVTIIYNIDQIEISNNFYTIHDMDLGYMLKLMKKLKMIDKVIIFGIPINTLSKIEILNQLKEKIRSTLV